jgi:hypothetical protein
MDNQTAVPADVRRYSTDRHSHCPVTNPYQPPTPESELQFSPQTAMSRLSRPATALVIMSSIQAVIWSIPLVSFAVLFYQGTPLGEDSLGILAGLAEFTALLIICIGAAKMGHLKSYRMARLSAILSFIPCVSPFFVIGIPFGIWSLKLLRDPTIQSEFPDSPKPKHGE